MSLPVDMAGEASRAGIANGSRRFWIALLVALMLVPIIGVWVVLVPIWRDLRVIAEIQRAGGSVTHYDTVEVPDFFHPDLPRKSHWERFFARVTGGARWNACPTGVALEWGVPADQLFAIAHIRGLDRIHLQGPQWTDAHLEWIARSVRITSLNLQDTSITGRGFAAFGNTPIDSLYLSWRYSKPKLQGGLAFVKGFDKLQSLRVEDVRLTVGDLLVLRDHPRLDHLGLSRITGTLAAVEILKTIPNLERLALIDCDIEDAGLAVLAEMPKLDSVDLSGGMITDSGLASLPRTLRWSYLNLDRNPITAAGMAAMPRYPAMLSIRDTCVEITAEHHRLLGPRGCERLVIRPYMADDEALAGPLRYLGALEVDDLQ